MQPILDIRGFSKSYDGKVMAVDNLSLTIEPGDIYGFIGKNGAGKTTTLRAAAGILRFDTGDMLVDGTSIKADPLACKRKIAYIPDNPDLYEFLTGRQYLDFVADLFEIAGDERGQRIEHYARALDLSDRLHDLISSYSHGMKQKLAMIGGFIHRPVLFLMDEPFVGLDPEAVVRVRQIIRDFCAQGSAVFFSTHVLEVAEKLCNKVAVIKDGRLVAAGATDQVRGQASLEEYFLEAMRDA
jgi:ABC-2 type transport system ATP-binding protein